MMQRPTMLPPASSMPAGRTAPLPPGRAGLLARAFCAGFFYLLLGLPGLAMADTDEAGPRPITVEVNGAEVVTLPAKTKSVIVADPEIADVQLPNATSLMVLGKALGDTMVYSFGAAGETARYRVSVRRNVTRIQKALRAQLPDAEISVAETANGLILSGSVRTPREAADLKAAAQQFLGEDEELSFNVTVEEAVQVNLRVRVAEVSRAVTKEFGFNWSALYSGDSVAVGLLTGRSPSTAFGEFTRSPNGLSSIGFGYRNNKGSVDISGLIDALVEEDLVSVLAEPNLTAMSGATANFLAGGEFPIPVSQGNQQVTIEFKRFGVAVDFIPVVLDNNRISIKVRSEVSELSERGSIVVENIRIPGLAVRRAETTVELGSGESFAIAGLFQNNATTQVDGLPWLKDLPILGALFRSNRYLRNESELVIIVTPYTVRPASELASFQLPTDGLVFPNDLEHLLLGRLTSSREGVPETTRGEPGGPGLKGPAGFMLE